MTTLATNLVSDWSFDSTPNDGQGANNLTLTGSPTYAAGLIANALSLTAASSQYANAPSSFVSTLSSAFTVSVWCKPTATAVGSNWARVFDWGTGTSTYCLVTIRSDATGTNKNTILWSSKVGGGTEYQAASPIVAAAGSWYHVCVTGDGTRVTLYVNGAAVAGNSPQSGGGAAGGGFLLSALGASANNYFGKSQFADPFFDGLIDQADLWSRALSPWEVVALYHAGAGYALASLAGASASTLASPLACQMVTFTGANGSEVLAVYESQDATWFRSVSASYTPPVGQKFRDPSVALYADHYVAPYTVAQSATDTSVLGIARTTSGIDLSAWTHVADWDTSAVTGGGSAPRSWAPEWARNQDGTLYLDPTDHLPRLFFAGCKTWTAGTADAFKIYVITPTDSTLSAGGTPTQVTGTAIPTATNGSIDPFPVLIGTTWHLFFKDETSKVIKCVTSSSLASGYDTTLISDLCGANVEGPCYLYINSKHRVYVDRYNTNLGQAYVESATLAGLSSSALCGLSVDGESRHGTILFLPPPPGPQAQGAVLPNNRVGPVALRQRWRGPKLVPAGVSLNNYVLTASAGSFALAGGVAALTIARKLTGTVGVFTLTGDSAGTYYGHKITTSTGSFILTGQSATILSTRKIIVSAATFTLTGGSAALQATRSMTASEAAFTISALSAGLSYTPGAASILASPGSFSLTGGNSTLLYSKRIVVGSAQFSLTGGQAALTRTRIMTISPAGFTLSGRPTVLTYSGTPTSPVFSIVLGGNVQRSATVEAAVQRNVMLSADAGSNS